MAQTRGQARAPRRRQASGRSSTRELAATRLPAAEHKTHSFRRKLLGKVVADKMNKTVVVEVVRRSRDPVYKKYVRTQRPLQGARREERIQGRRPRRDHGAPPHLQRQALEVVRLVARAVEE